MQVTEQIHALKIPFKIPISPEQILDRFAYAYIIFGKVITLIDTGVAGSEALIFEYIRQHHRDPREIATIILTHAHPDHIGSAKVIQISVNCKIIAHGDEKDWIEDTDRQFKERPVPGFQTLVAGPVVLDKALADGELLDLSQGILAEVMHTPGHSKGSVSLWFKNEKILISGDALPFPNDLPTYDDVVTSVQSIKKLERMNTAEILLSSWEAPIYGQTQIRQRIATGIDYLRRIHAAVLKVKAPCKSDLMDVTRQVIADLGLPPLRQIR